MPNSLSGLRGKAMLPEPTPSQIERVERQYSRLAGGEPVTANLIGGAWYIFGSELAVLRIFHKQPQGRAGYSENRETWYYAFEDKI